MLGKLVELTWPEELEDQEIGAWLLANQEELLALIEEDIRNPPTQSNWRELFEDDE